MERSHLGTDPFDPNAGEFEYTRLECMCISRNTHEELQKHLRTVRNVMDKLDVMTIKNEKEPAIHSKKDISDRQKAIIKLLKAVEKTQTELSGVIRKYCSDQRNFSRQMGDQIKRHAINVPPNRQPLVTVPHQAGMATVQKPSKKAFLKRYAPPILPVVTRGGIAELDPRPPPPMSDNE